MLELGRDFYILKSRNKIFEIDKNRKIDFADEFLSRGRGNYISRGENIVIGIDGVFVRIRNNYFFMNHFHTHIYRNGKIDYILSNSKLFEQMYDEKDFLPFKIEEFRTAVELHIKRKDLYLKLSTSDLFKRLFGEFLKEFDVKIFAFNRCKPLKKFKFNEEEFNSLHLDKFNLTNPEQAFEKIEDEKFIKKYLINKNFS